MLAKSDFEKLQKQAQSAVKHAVRRGELVREPCAVCGAEGVQAHHEVYSPKRHLTVAWLCKSCHRKHHAQLAAMLPEGAQLVGVGVVYQSRARGPKHTPLPRNVRPSRVARNRVWNRPDDF